MNKKIKKGSREKYKELTITFILNLVSGIILILIEKLINKYLIRDKGDPTPLSIKIISCLSIKGNV